MVHVSFWFMLMMLICWEEAYILQRKKIEALVDSKETGLEVNADKAKYTAMSRDQNAGRSRNIKIDNSSFEMAEQFKYFGATLANKNSIQEEIKSIGSQGMLAIMCCKMFCFPVGYPKI